MNLRTWLGWPERILIILGFLLIGLWFMYDTNARSVRTAERRALATMPRVGAFSDAPAIWLAEAPWCPTRLDSGVFGRIEIRRLGISALIAEGTDPAQLEGAVGHIPTSVFPGRPGNCTLTGLLDRHLRGLGDVRENDVIRIDTLEDTYTYVVVWSGAPGQRRAEVPDAKERPSLTLVTFAPIPVAGQAPERFVVRARLVEPTASLDR